MIADHQFREVFSHNCFIKLLILFLISLDKECSWSAQKNVDNCHIEKILSGSDMWALDSVPEKDIAHYQKIDVAAMCWYYNQRTLVLIVSLNPSDCVFVYHNSLVNRFEELGQKPTKQPDRIHWIVTKHLKTHLLCYLGELFLCFLEGSWRVLQLEHTLLYHSFDGFFYWFAIEYILSSIVSTLACNVFALSQCPHYVRKIWLILGCNQKIYIFRFKLLNMLVH